VGRFPQAPPACGFSRAPGERATCCFSDHSFCLTPAGTTPALGLGERGRPGRPRADIGSDRPANPTTGERRR
jgi:hypothetical protein